MIVNKVKYYVVDDERGCFRGFILSCSENAAKNKLYQLFPRGKYRLGSGVVDYKQ